MIDIYSFLIVELLPEDICESLHFFIKIRPSFWARSLKASNTELILMRRSNVYISSLLRALIWMLDSKFEKFHHIVSCSQDKRIDMLLSKWWLTTKPTILTELVIKSQDNITLSIRICRLSLNKHFNSWIIWGPFVSTVTARTSIDHVCLVSFVTKLLVDEVVILIISSCD